MLLSPFSSSHNFSVRSAPYRPRIFAYPTPRQILIKNILNCCGIAAALTLGRLWSANGQKKLKALASAGYMARHFLDGRIKLNVYSFKPNFDVKKDLRKLPIAQLYVKLREHTPCHITPAEPFPILTIRGRHFQLVSFRREDTPELFLPFLDHPTIIICETLTKFPNARARLTTDQDLIEQPLSKCFYLPDGTPDRSSFFPRLQRPSIGEKVPVKTS